MKPIRDLRAYASSIIQDASPHEGGRIAVRALHGRARAPWLQRMVTVLTSLAVFSAANVGLALAANSAVPGDPLYGIDRAYEKVETALGIRTNHSAERFEEAAVLSSRGDLPRALEVASEAARGLDNPGLDRAIEAITQASEDAKDLEPEVTPPGLEKKLNAQAQELFGIGREVSEVASSHDGAAAEELEVSFDKKADEVLATVHEAQAEMKAAKEARRQEKANHKPEVPPGQEKRPTP